MCHWILERNFFPIEKVIFFRFKLKYFVKEPNLFVSKILKGIYSKRLLLLAEYHLLEEPLRYQVCPTQNGCFRSTPTHVP